MAYSNISDAFNINGKFQETIKGLQSFNPMNSDLANLRNSYGSLTNIENNYEAPYDSNYETPYGSSYESCNQSLNGTNINNLLTNQTKNDRNDRHDKNDKNFNDNKQKSRLTHRDCINIYTKPTHYSDEDIGNALKHVTKCSMCKEQIKKLQNSVIGVNSPSASSPNLSISNYSQALESAHTTGLTSMLGNQIPANATPPITTTLNLPLNSHTNSQTNSNPNSQPNSQIENQLKMLNEKINGETNMKYQNAVLENTISKYMEDSEEKKAFNYKIDRILELLQTQAQTQAQVQAQAQAQAQPQLSPKEYFMTLNSMLRPEMFQNSTNSNELNYVTIGIVIIIILLIVDILIRINTKNSLN